MEHDGDASRRYRKPLSFAQQRLWLLDRLSPQSSLYNVAHVLRLQGVLDAAALRSAFDALARRHEVLRTRFETIDGQPAQIIDAEPQFEWDIEDLSAPAAGERALESRRRAEIEANKPFDLARGPLMRARVLRLDEREHWLLLTLHHIVTDRWSMGVLAEEVSALYAAKLEGCAASIDALPVQFADYAIWQREFLQGCVLEEQLAYWKQSLCDLQPLELPADRKRPAIGRFRAGRVYLDLGEALTRLLKNLSRRENATLFMTLLASFQVLLFRYSGQEDVAVGVPVAGRRRPELEGLIGCFVNTLVLRGDLSGEPSFRTFLERTRARVLADLRYQDLPFEKLVEELAPVRDPSRNPLFQVAFTLQNTPPRGWRLPGIDVERLEEIAADGAKFDLSLTLSESGESLRARLEYATELFDAVTIERMAAQWRSLLEDIVAHPDSPVSRLKLIDDDERRRILVDWNATRTSYPADASIAAVFAAQARRTPDSIALIDGPRTLTYAALDFESDALAHRLTTAGAAAGARVAVCIERSIDEVIALLGVLKTGCAYVPLDPGHPPERLAELVTDADVAAVVTVESALRALAVARAKSERPVLMLGRAEALAAQARADPLPATRGDDPAYVMFTSGSTGTPKGVVIPQRAVLRLVLGTDYVQLGRDDVVAHLSNPAFDAATFEIWGALLNGAKLAVIPRDAVLSPPQLAAALDAAAVSTLFLTTALFNQIARDAPAAFARRQVLFGGEAAEPPSVAAALSAGEPRQLLHVYGPTEATTFATWHEVREIEPDALTVPIGKPIANTEVYILDEHREPVPPGIPGEIWIGGPGLALGYLNDAALTSDRFIAHPFSADPGARLYRTRDRARYRADGAIEFMGRFDNQIKIRGYRIEPAEVEAALLKLPRVRQAIVLAHGTTSATRRLSAYVVPAEGATLTPQDLWLDLRRTLPEYLVPHGIVLLQALPITPSGKIDRRALPDPVDLADRNAASRAPPATLIEHMLATIWKRLLGVRGIGVRDSFFDLGGHSLLAAQMIDEIERACAVRLPVTALFTASTIERIAEMIRVGVTTAAPIDTLNGGGSRPPLFFLHGDYYEGGLYCRGLAAALGSEQPFHAVHPHGLDGKAVPPSIESMAADRVAVIRRERPHGPYFLGGHCNGALVAVEIARQLIDAGEEVPVVVVLDGVAREGFVEFSAGAPPSSERGSRRDRSATPVLVNERDVVDVMGRFRDAVRKYVPKRFPGRIAVLRSAGTRDTRPDLGWRSFAAEVETHALPGSHLTSVTRHVATTAECIKSCLEAAYPSAAWNASAGAAAAMPSPDFP
jgi:amino acid adenylation domain-containing protein